VLRVAQRLLEFVDEMLPFAVMCKQFLVAELPQFFLNHGNVRVDF
jgi:hypothetical protein